MDIVADGYDTCTCLHEGIFYKKRAHSAGWTNYYFYLNKLKSYFSHS